jgi:methionyl-tRNA formyltransferase
VPIEPRDDVATVWEKLSRAACDIIDSVRGPLEDGRLTEHPQSLAEATYRPRRQPQDGLIDWATSAAEIRNWVRALTKPYPGAMTFYDRSRLVIWDGRPVSRDAGAASPGTVVGIADDGIDVATGDGVYRLTRVQYGDKPEAWADEFGARVDLKCGDSFGTEQAPTDWQYTGIRGPSGGYDYETNLDVGETGAVTLLAMSSTRQEDLTARVSFGDQVTDVVDLSGRDTRHKAATYTPTEQGTETVTIQFESGDETVDTRYLKVFTAG